MTYSAGNKIVPTDIVSFVGNTDSNLAYASSIAATAKAAALWGVGYGDRGYGQSAYILTSPTGGTKVKASLWHDLYAAINVMASHQGTPGANFDLTKFTSGLPIKTIANISALLSTLDTARFSTNGGASMTLTVGAFTSTRSSTWGSGNTSIFTDVDVAFVSEDAARYFFNSGGEIRLSFAHPNGATSQDIAWRTIFTNIGTLSLKANSFTRSGVAGTLLNGGNAGYYGLTTTNQTFLDGTNIGSGAYSANDVTVQIMAPVITGSNGAKGATIRFRITLADQHNTGFQDLVAAGTNVSFSYLKATGILTGINNPTASLITSF